MATSAPIGALRADLMANSAMFAADMQRARNAVQTATAAMQKSFSQFQRGANNAVKEIFNFRNAAVVLAGGALVAFVRQNVKAAAEIDDTSQRLGISAERFQELSYAAKIAGVNQEDFTKALEQFNKRLGDFKGGVTGAQTALGQLGLTMADIKGKTPDEALKLVADRLAAIPDPMRRAAIEAELFGRAGVKLDNVLTLGAAGLNHYAGEAHKLGFVLSNETIKKAAEADDEFDRIGKSLKVAGINIAAGFLPALTEVRKIFTSQDFQDGVRATSAALADFVKWMVDNKDTIIIVSTTLAGLKLGAAFGGAFGKQGAVIGAVTGALTGMAAGAELAEQSTARLNNEITKITVNKGIQPIPNPISPEVAKAIDDLIFKARVIKGDFDQLAEGFPEAAKGLKVFGTTADENRVSVALLTPELQKLNEAQMIFKGAQMTQEALLPWQLYEQQLMRINQALAAGVISHDTYSRQMQMAAEKAGTSWTIAGASIAGSFADIAGSFGKEQGAMAKAAKAFAIVQAVISAYEGASKALTLPFPANLAAAAVVLAKGFAFVAAIKSQNVPKFATGGSFKVGGAGGIDSQLVQFKASPGEMVDIHKGEPQRGSGGDSVTITVKGINAREYFRGDVLRDLVGNINEFIGDGGKLKVAAA